MLYLTTCTIQIILSTAYNCNLVHAILSTTPHAWTFSEGKGGKSSSLGYKATIVSLYHCKPYSRFTRQCSHIE